MTEALIALIIVTSVALGTDWYCTIRDQRRKKKAKKAEFVRRLRDDAPEGMTVDNIMKMKMDYIIVEDKVVLDFEVQHQVEEKIKRALVAEISKRTAAELGL